MLSIIVPTYNERGNLPRLVDEVFTALKGEKAELVIIDDNSPDGTGKLADELAKTHNIQVVHRPGKLGLSSAVVAGFAKATGDVLCVMDADLSHPPSALPRVLKPIKDGTAELVVASRYMPGGGVEVWSLARRVTSLAATLLARPLTRVRDPMSGFFLFKKDVIDGISFQAQGYKIGLEIIVKGKYKTVTEVPYMFRNREVGKSKLSLSEDYYYLKNLARFYTYWLLNPKKRSYVNAR